MVVEIEFGGDGGDRILCSAATRAGINQEEWLHAATLGPWQDEISTCLP
jgi:hypothetical protein